MEGGREKAFLQENCHRPTLWGEATQQVAQPTCLRDKHFVVLYLYVGLLLCGCLKVRTFIVVTPAAVLLNVLLKSAAVLLNQSLNCVMSAILAV